MPDDVQAAAAEPEQAPAPVYTFPFPIPDELATEAFERFTRGDSARTRGGAGLGLAIVSAIAGAHGGSAEILDGEDGRTTVRLRLPQLALRKRVESGAHA